MLGGRRAARTPGPTVNGDANRTPHPSVGVLAPGGKQIQCGRQVGDERRARNALAQDVCCIPDIGGDDIASASSKCALAVTVQLLTQGFADDDPAALGLGRGDALQKDIH